jgi:hypothetical protein
MWCVQRVIWFPKDKFKKKTNSKLSNIMTLRALFDHYRIVKYKITTMLFRK